MLECFLLRELFINEEQRKHLIFLATKEFFLVRTSADNYPKMKITFQSIRSKSVAIWESIEHLTFGRALSI